MRQTGRALAFELAWSAFLGLLQFDFPLQGGGISGPQSSVCLVGLGLGTTVWTGELGVCYLTLRACGKVGLAYLEPPERQTSSLSRLRPGLGREEHLAGSSYRANPDPCRALLVK